MNPIPQVLKDARVYRNGGDFVARAKTIKLPDLVTLTETFEGFGTAGPIDVPIQGMLENLEGHVQFAGISRDQFAMLDSGIGHMLDCRAAQTAHEPITGLQVEQQIKAVVRAHFHKAEFPDQERAQADGLTWTYSASYYLLAIDGQTVVEVDKMMGVCRVLRAGVLVDLNLQTKLILGQM